MKTWIKATIVALLAIFTTSCDWDDDNCGYRDAYHLFVDKTWSRIEETPNEYYYFVCYDFYRDGTYQYWFYEDDGHTPGPTYSIETGRWEVISHGGSDDIRLYVNGVSDTYNVDEFLKGLSDCNSKMVIDSYIKDIDELYHAY